MVCFLVERGDAMVNSEDDAKQMYMLVQKAAKFSFDKLVATYLKNQRTQTGGKSGKTKLKNLVKNGNGQVSSFEFSDENTKQFERYAKKFGIQFSIMKEQSADDKLPTFKVFFKAKDEDVIRLAFEKYSTDRIKQKGKAVEVDESFSLDALAKNKELVKANNKERDVSKNKHQEQSL